MIYPSALFEFGSLCLGCCVQVAVLRLLCLGHCVSVTCILVSQITASSMELFFSIPWFSRDLPQRHTALWFSICFLKLCEQRFCLHFCFFSSDFSLGFVAVAVCVVLFSSKLRSSLVSVSRLAMIGWMDENSSLYLDNAILGSFLVCLFSLTL